jgi:hypothetical protein
VGINTWRRAGIHTWRR